MNKSLGVMLSAVVITGCPQGAPVWVSDDGGDASDDASTDAALEAASEACEAGGCAECVADDDCPAAAKHCQRGSCVACRIGLSDCPGTDRACWTSDLGCHPRCGAQVDCFDGGTCDEVTGECVECKVDADCNDRVCDQARGICVECVADEDCPSARPFCLARDARCIACRTDDDCGNRLPVCDPTTFMCRSR
jgi:hypothetical protein